MRILLFFLFTMFSCGKITKKQNDDMPPNQPQPEEIKSRLEIYKKEGSAVYDDQGLYASHGIIGDSALFSCLAYSAGLAKFDVGLFFRTNGMPRRHPDISPSVSKTPISKDMVNGLLFCIHKLGKTDNDHASALLSKMIKAGKENSFSGMWNFCTKEDIKEYAISKEDIAGRCLMTPSIMKDAFRVYVWLGHDCDFYCKSVMAIGVNNVPRSEGYRGHLAVLSTVRNGLVEGGINDVSLDQLKYYAEKYPNNALYVAAYNRFKNGDQSKTWQLLSNEKLFPKERASSSNEYCTDYLYQRDEVVDKSVKPVEKNGKLCVTYFHPETKKKVEGCGFPLKPDGTVLVRMYNGDWLPCPGNKDKKGMVDWGFARALANGEI